MVDVLTEITIDRPVDEVARYAVDPSNAPEWYANIESVEWETSPPAEVGSKVAFVARFLGRRLAYTYELAELVPGRRLVMRTAQGPFPMETIYTWQPVGEGSTRMTLRNRAVRVLKDHRAVHGRCHAPRQPQRPRAAPTPPRVPLNESRSLANLAAPSVGRALRGRYAGKAREDLGPAPRDATRNTTASNGSATTAAHARPPTSPVASPSSATMPCPANHAATASRAARSGLDVRARPTTATQSAAVADTAYRRTRNVVAAGPSTSSSEPSTLVGSTASATATPPVSTAAASKTRREFTTPA
jgi:uncharacterized protein YndB with AHSA1/START domain